MEVVQATLEQQQNRPNDVTRPLILGRYIVAHPKICHGKPTFRGTRIMVADVLEQVADGLDWDSISESWGGKITREAIAEALSLARTAFLKHVHEFEIEPLPA
jgi:uncharacterized protein (DUF433 family)